MVRKRVQEQVQRPLRVAAYARVSTVMQLKEHDSSIDTQLRAIRRRAEYEAEVGNPPWEIIEYREEGRSAKDTNRPQLQRLLFDSRAGKIDLVVVTRIDRISRSLMDFFSIQKELSDHGVDFMALDDHYDTSTPGGKLTLRVMLSLAEYEREQTSLRIKGKTHDRMREGLWFGGVIPLGYQKHPTDRTSLAVNEEEAKIVKLIFRKFLEIRTGRGTTKWLNDHGIVRPRNGAPFRVQAVMQTLQNKYYIAKRDYEGEEVSCNWPAIIDEKTFRNAQKIIAANRVEVPKGRPSSIVPLLDSLLRCPCGAVFGVVSGTSKTGAVHHYYSCRNKVKKPGSCKQRDIPVEVVESFVLDEVRRIALSGELIADAVKKANDGKDSELAKLKEDWNLAKNALGQKRAVINRLVDAIAMGQGSKALADRLAVEEAALVDLEARTLDLKTRVQALESRTLNAAIIEAGYRELAYSLDKALTAGQREEVRRLLKGIVEVIDWVPSPEDPRKGKAILQLWALPGVQKSGTPDQSGQGFFELSNMVEHSDTFSNSLTFESSWDFSPGDRWAPILKELAVGGTQAEVASRLGVSVRTVRRAVAASLELRRATG